MNSTGYSGRSLVQKLGVMPGHRVKTPVDVWHSFTASRAELEYWILRCQSEIQQDGMIWVSWPKKSSGVFSEITGNDIRVVALPLGLVDVKVCAVDEVWSGLKLMIRKANRANKGSTP
jgi:hypothetical protein